MAPKIVCVVGPTACGKTKMGVLIAQKFNGEVVSVDSMQIYRGMTVGTAAPTEEEMCGVPHHMVAVADPNEQWSAARYAEAAIACVDDILSRGKLPVLVGGTGLWLDAVVKGHGFAGGHAESESRRILQQRLEQEGIGPLLEELRQEYDWVLIDTPPLSQRIDGMIISACCDGALLVLRQGAVSLPDARRCLSRLKRSGTRLLGAVLTHAPTPMEDSNL